MSGSDAKSVEALLLVRRQRQTKATAELAHAMAEVRLAEAQCLAHENRLHEHRDRRAQRTNILETERPPKFRIADLERELSYRKRLLAEEAELVDQLTQAQAQLNRTREHLEQRRTVLLAQTKNTRVVERYQRNLRDRERREIARKEENVTDDRNALDWTFK